MNPIHTVQIHAISKALSPITHNAKTSGNETVINRERVKHRDTIKDVPVLSGNAIRHRMIREPGAMHLVNAIGLAGKLNIGQANYLFNGGSLTESSISDNLKRIADMQELFPLIRLLGGSLNNQIIGGSLVVKRGVLVCEETRDQVQPQLPEGYMLPEESLRTCEDYLSGYQYTRGSAERNKDARLLLAEPQTDGSNLMIYNGQTVIPGAVFYHGFVLQNVSRLEVGALIHALSLWAESGATIGGSARIGHGQLETSLYIEPVGDWFGSDVDVAESVKEYLEHVQANKERAASWLKEAFPR